MVSLIRLIDGTEIVGEVKEENDEVIVDNPMQINYKIRSDSQLPVISMLRFMPFAKTPNIKIKKTHIISSALPMNGLVKYYNSSIKSMEETELDKSIDEEFANAANEELSEEMQIKMAMMEKAALKPPLN
jgi:hypothetical protein